MITLADTWTITDGDVLCRERNFVAGDACVLRIRNLRLPFGMQMIARRGRHRFASGRREGTLEQGRSVSVEPYRTVHYDGTTAIDPRVGYELHLLLHDEKSPVADEALAARVALAVFREPASDWSVALAAQRMELNAQNLKAQLFRENHALTAIVREQRLMRALLALLAQPRARNNLAALAGRFGFTSATRMNDAFAAHFGCPASRVAKFAWYPALTWSMRDDVQHARGVTRAIADSNDTEWQW
ncbi:hypothetical protein [Paraburkholderia sp. GAS32]|uniref:hypothetical protein n=1 Tax=Paraburkholderia sp. GAS32 TaxID=3035129 RepID=UPI003D1B9448